MKLIGINGRLRSGKDTAVAFIREAAHPRVVERTGFADKIKLSGVRALGFDPATVEEAVEIANRIKEAGSVVSTWSIDDPKPSPRDATDFRRRTQILKSKTITGREFWQRYGTEAHREVFETDFWVNHLLPTPGMGGSPSARFPGVDVLCITDVRYPNEARRILDLGGVVWQIDAEQRLGPLPEGSHPSEYPLPPEYVTIRVPNNTTIEQFQVACRTAWELTEKC